MKVLSVNAGSSSIKFKLFEMPEEKVLVSSNFERIGSFDSVYTLIINNEKIKKIENFSNHKEAIEIFLKELINYNIINDISEIKYIGHRVVHGGEKYNKSVLITEEVLKDIHSYSVLAPLHNPENLIGIKTIVELIPNSINIAVFDTAFHQTIEKEKYMYPIPYKYYEDFKIRKYGFHGISHNYLYLKAKSMGFNKIITCHLGNGCSISAIENDKCISNSLGFTPLSGLMMGTRSGDIDPSIISFIMKNDNKTIDEVMDILNKKSGMLGISEYSSDFRDICNKIFENDEKAILAHDMFVERVISFISYYYVLLNKAEAIIFSGGIGEHDPYTRSRIIKRLETLNIYLDSEKNELKEDLLEITTSDSKTKCLVIYTDEELMIAKELYNIIEKRN